jgi:hypothetical protein
VLHQIWISRREFSSAWLDATLALVNTKPVLLDANPLLVDAISAIVDVLGLRLTLDRLQKMKICKSKKTVFAQGFCPEFLLILYFII